jgi:hypothetical protein
MSIFGSTDESCNPNDDKIDRDDIVKESGHDENQYPCNESNQRLEREMNIHRRVLLQEILLLYLE